MNNLAGEISDLANAAIDGSITDAQAARLQALLAESQENRQVYVRFMTLSATLLAAAQDSLRAQQANQQLQNEAQLPPAAEQPSVLRRIFAHPARRVALIAAAAACLVVAALLSLKTETLVTAPPPPTFAQVQDAMNPVWSNTGAASGPVIGTRLPAGALHLDSGLVRIEFDSGANIRVEGPADFDILSANSARLNRGKLVARVPHQAAGFAVDSPLVKVVDLGTMFGLDLTASNAGQPLAAVHVFEGTVEIDRPLSDSLQLHQDEAIALGSSPDLRFTSDPHVFQDWDFAERPSTTRGPHDLHSFGMPWRPTDSIFMALNADSVRRAVLEQKVEALVEAYRGLNGDPMMDDAVWRSRNDLFNAALTADSTDEDLAAKIAAVREARASARQTLESAKQSLRESLTPREEAILVLQNWLD